MAAVLNKTTLHYLPSANTPDYLDGNWYINPDMSAVNGVPSKYWIITDVPAVYDTDGVTIITFESAIVTAMDSTQQAAYDAANPPAPDYIRLPDGSPTFLYAPTNTYISIAKSDIMFSSNGTNVINFYLGCYPDEISSNIKGYRTTLKSVVTTLIASVTTAVATDTTFSVMVGANVLRTIVLSAEQTSVIQDLDTTILNLGDMISVYVSGTSNISNPTLVLEIHKSW